MRVLVTGATGFIGKPLCAALKERGHVVRALSRDAAAAEQGVPALEKAFGWSPLAGPAPAEAFAGVDVVVNLAGETVVGRWTEAKKNAIRDSRVVGTRHLVAGMSQLESRSKILVSASAVGYYGDRGDEELTEDSAAANDFLGKVSQDWEREAMQAESLGLRVARIRIGIVLAKDGGALGSMLLPFKLGAGGPLGSGQQWWSWIHRDDLIGLMLFLLESEQGGAVNATAPKPVRQEEFASVLGRVLKRPAFIPAPAFAMKIILGEFAGELLSSQRVLPKAAQEMGYRFQYSDLEQALKHAISA